MCEFKQQGSACTGNGSVAGVDFSGFIPQEHYWPCPCCNTEQYLIEAKRDAEAVPFYPGRSGFESGLDLWKSAVSIASQWNALVAESTLLKLGPLQGEDS